MTGDNDITLAQASQFRQWPGPVKGGESIPRATPFRRR